MDAGKRLSHVAVQSPIYFRVVRHGSQAHVHGWTRTTSSEGTQVGMLVFNKFSSFIQMSRHSFNVFRTSCVLAALNRGTSFQPLCSGPTTTPRRASTAVAEPGTKGPLIDQRCIFLSCLIILPSSCAFTLGATILADVYLAF